MRVEGYGLRVEGRGLSPPRQKCTNRAKPGQTAHKKSRGRACPAGCYPNTGRQILIVTHDTGGESVVSAASSGRVKFVPLFNTSRREWTVHLYWRSCFVTYNDKVRFGGTEGEPGSRGRPCRATRSPEGPCAPSTY